LGRRSRKRGAAPAPRPAAPPRPVPAPPDPSLEQPAPPRRPRGEERAAALRADLEPLAPGERPRAVTAAAIVCAVAVVVLAMGWLTGLIEHRPGRASGLVTSLVILAVAGAGMWRARYWAVLGFEAILALNIVFMFLLLLRASSVLAVAIALVVMVPASYLFYKLVRAMARLQMPERS
jgi:hypothetical protein